MCARAIAAVLSIYLATLSSDESAFDCVSCCRSGYVCASDRDGNHKCCTSGGSTLCNGACCAGTCASDYYDDRSYVCCPEGDEVACAGVCCTSDQMWCA